MSKKEIIEDSNISSSKLSSGQRRKNSRHKRNVHLAVLCATFSIIVLLGTAFIVVHSISNKEKLREQGIAAFKAGSYNEAIADFKASIELRQWFSSKMDADTGLYLAAAYMRSGEYIQAYNIYNDFINDGNPTTLSKDTLNDMATLASALDNIQGGNITEATVESLNKELQRGNNSAYLYLGLCYQQMGKTDEMLDAFNKYIETYGINTYISYQLSSYYLGSGDVDTAVTYINKGLSCGDELYKDKIMFNDIVVSETKLDYATALDKATKLLADYPENDIYQKEYDFLYSRINVNDEPVHTKTDDE
jgi:tetratricopeptide (TPR) repeat protein